MAECEIPVVPAYTGAETCVGDADTQRLSFCVAFVYLKDTLVPYINDVFVVKLNDCRVWISEQVAKVATDRDFVAGAKTLVEVAMGATYAGAWNTTGDFTNKEVTYNNALWVGVSPIAGTPPSLNGNWLFVSYVKKTVEINSDYTATMGDEIRVDTTNNIVNITFPNPTEDGIVEIIDKELMFSTNKVNLTFQNATFYKKSEVIELKDDTSSFTFICRKMNNNNFDWRIK